MALKTRAAFFNVATDIQTNRLYPTSRLVSSITGMPIPRNKAVVGENAFAHESGIHQHGMLKHHSTYEIMRPEDVGLSRSHLVLGKHSGRHAFRERVQALGFELDELEFNRVFEEFKALADKKKELFDGDIEALVLRAEGSASGPWTLTRAHHRGEQQRHRARARAPARTPTGAASSAARAATGRWMPPSRRSRRRPASRWCCASSRCTRCPRARTRRARRASTWSTITRPTGARASAPTSSSRRTRAFLEVINRIELAASRCAFPRGARRGRHRRLRSPHAHPGHAVHLVQRQARALGEGHGARALPRAALRLLGVRGRARLRDPARAWRSSACAITRGACSTRPRSTASRCPSPPSS